MENQNVNANTANTLPAITPPAICSEIRWMPGPANDGEGTAGKDSNGNDLWWDGDLLLITIDTVGGRETTLIHVAADGDQLGMIDPLSGDYLCDYGFDEIEWWARLDEGNLPPPR